VTTLVVVRGLERDRVSGAEQVLYGLFAALGLATHLYMVGVLALHGGYLLLRRRNLLDRFVIPWLIAVALGALAFLDQMSNFKTVNEVLGHRFLRTFPIDLTVELLGGFSVTTIALAILLAPEVWRHRRSRNLWAGTGLIAALVVAMWLVIRPYDLYPRFYFWLLLLPAVGAAMVVRRRPVLAIAFGAIVVAQLVVAWPRLTTDPLGNTRAAPAIRWAVDHGGTACVFDTASALRLAPYLHPRDLILVPSSRVPHECTVVVSLIPGFTRQYNQRGIGAGFRYKVRLPGLDEGTLWSSVPASCWEAKRNEPTAACHL
jgi:hypothetical protein